MAAEVIAAEGDLASADGTRLRWRSWKAGSARGAVAVAHGLGEHSGRYGRLAAALNRRGYDCYAVDLRGMGASDGRRGHVDSWSDWVEDFTAFHTMVFEQAGGLEVVPLGHSFGGVVLTTAILDAAIAPARFVLSNPAFRPAVAVPGWKAAIGKLASRILPTLTMANEVDPATVSRDPEVVAAYSADHLVHDRISSRLYTEWEEASRSALARAGEVKIPFFLIVSESDRLVSPDGSREFDAGADCQQLMRVYPARYHEPFNDLGAEEVFADLAAWLDGRPGGGTVNGQG